LAVEDELETEDFAMKLPSCNVPQPQVNDLRIISPDKGSETAFAGLSFKSD
jgi:hypothetical protein